METDSIVERLVESVKIYPFRNTVMGGASNIRDIGSR